MYKNVRAGANECSHLCCESIIQSWKIHLVKTHCHGIHNLKSRVPYTSLPVAISFGFVPGRGIVLGSVCILSTSDMIADSSRRFLMSLAVFRAAGGRATGSPIKGPSRKIARSGCHGGTMRSSPHCTLSAASVLARDRPFGFVSGSIRSGNAISACMDGTKALVRPIQEDETPCPGDSALSDFLIMLR